MISRFLRGLEKREFFLMLASRVTNWDKIDGNPFCLHLPWSENNVYLKKFRQVYNVHYKGLFDAPT